MREDIVALISQLGGSKPVTRFYDTVYNYLLCPYMRFLEPVIPEEERAPLPESVLERMESGNRFEAAQVAKLIATSHEAGRPVIFASGSYAALDLTSDAVAQVKAFTSDAPTHRSFGLATTDTYSPLPTDGRKRGPVIRHAVEAATASGSSLLVIASDDYHEIADADERSAARDEIVYRTVSGIADGIDAMRDGKPAPILIGPRLPRTYVAEMDSDLVGEPDLLVPVPSLTTYTSVDYKDASVLTASTRTNQHQASPATSPFLEDATKTDLGPGILNKKHRLQLFHYQLMLEPLLEALGTKATPQAAIIGRQGYAVWSDQTEKVFGRAKDRKSAEEIYFSTVSASNDAYALGELFAQGVDVEVPAELNPARRAECAECPFRRHCEEERRRNGGHLTLHPDIGAEMALELAEILPTPSLESLAFSDAADLLAKAQVQDVKGLGPTVEAKHAKIQVLIDGARSIHSAKSYRRRDQSRVPTLEAVVEVHFDLENNNNPMAGGKVPANYWFQTGYVHKKGLDALAEKVTVRYSSKFADGSPASEAEMFAQFWASMHRSQQEASPLYDEIRRVSGTAALNRLRANGGTELLDATAQRLGASSRTDLASKLGEEELAGIVPFRAFVYSPAELRIMRAKATEHEGFPGVPSRDEVEAWFACQTPGRPESAVAVDLWAFLDTYVHLPLPDRKLKTVAPYIGHYWDVHDPSGLIATYKADVMLSSPGTAEAEAAKKWLWSYNKADCAANLAVRRFIDATPWKGVAKLDDEGVFRARFPRRAARRNTDLSLFDQVD